MIIAQITDLHVSLPGQRMDRMFNTSDHLEKAVTRIISLEPAPDVVIITGDLVQDGTVEEYQRLTQIIKPIKSPIYVIPGNHDNREAMRKTFGELSNLSHAGGFLQYVIDEWPVRLIALDTLVPGRICGELCKYRLQWLNDRLSEEPEKPTIIFMHHPPIQIGIKSVDRHSLRSGGPEMGAIVEKYPNTKRIICGHLHRPITANWHGTLVSVTPSTAHQMSLNMGENKGQNIIMEPPALHLHVWEKNSVMISHMVYIKEYGTPIR